MTESTETMIAPDDETPKVYIRPPRNKWIYVVWAVAYVLIAAVITGAIAANVVFSAKVDRLRSDALAEHGIVLTDEQARTVLVDGQYALLDGDEVFLVTLAEGDAFSDGHYELSIYVPVEDAHVH